MLMDWREYYLREVYPRLDLPLAEKYPLLSLDARVGHVPLGDLALVMLVALTGTGKSTALGLLRARLGDGDAVIPSRRELADWIAIPMAQSLAGAPLGPVRDRGRRFACTRHFAERVPGGMAAAFSWLNLAEGFAGLLLTEGLRGRNEIGYALCRFPRWRIVELTLDPVTRLRRLSGRADDFDQARGARELSFLPPKWRGQAAALFKAGEISGKALAIVQAEAANYGFEPFLEGSAHPNYHRLEVDGLGPDAVAAAVAGIIDEARCQK